MTFSRAQMIEAYLAGSRERKKYAKVPDHDAAFRYVDSLQDAKNISAGPTLDSLVGSIPELGGVAIFHRLEGLDDLVSILRDIARSGAQLAGKADSSHLCQKTEGK